MYYKNIISCLGQYKVFVRETGAVNRIHVWQGWVQAAANCVGHFISARLDVSTARRCLSGEITMSSECHWCLLLPCEFLFIYIQFRAAQTRSVLGKFGHVECVINLNIIWSVSLDLSSAPILLLLLKLRLHRDNNTGVGSVNNNLQNSLCKLHKKAYVVDGNVVACVIKLLHNKSWLLLP